MKKMLSAITAILCISLCAVPVTAKDLKGKVGVGYEALALGPVNIDLLQQISVRYWYSNDWGMEANVGFIQVSESGLDDTATSDNSARGTAIGVRVMRNFIREQNMNIYAGGGAGILSLESKTGYNLDAFLGAEFFLQGLPNLGFSSEVGLGTLKVDNISISGTKGGSFLNMGIRYYF